MRPIPLTFPNQNGNAQFDETMWGECVGVCVCVCVLIDEVQDKKGRWVDDSAEIIKSS